MLYFLDRHVSYVELVYRSDACLFVGDVFFENDAMPAKEVLRLSDLDFLPSFDDLYYLFLNQEVYSFGIRACPGSDFPKLIRTQLLQLTLKMLVR